MAILTMFTALRRAAPVIDVISVIIPRPPLLALPVAASAGAGDR